MTREEFIKGLRDLADIFEKNPDLPHNKYYFPIDIWAGYDRESTKKAIKTFIRACNGEVVKVLRDASLELREKRDLMRLVVARNHVCERRVVGKKFVPEYVIPAHEEEIVEWDCRPLLEEINADD